MKLVKIPFSGFYESLHVYELEHTLTRMFESDSCDAYHEVLHDIAKESIDFKKVFLEYSEKYAELFLFEKLSIETFKGVELESPRFYNFDNDVIVVRICEKEVERLYADTNKEVLHTEAARQYASRDGFFSFYDSDYTQWGPLESWDHNQIHTLIQAYLITVDQEYDSLSEFETMESARCNGFLESILEANMDAPGARALQIAGYLRDRAARGPGYSKTQNTFTGVS